MTRPEPAQVRQIAIIGSGVIGSGWAAHFLRMGLGVIAWDPAPDAEDKLYKTIEQVWPTMEKLGLQEGASPDNLMIVAELAEACHNADFVQENAPEQAELKSRLLAEIDAVTPTAIVVASSTSGFAMTALQGQCKNPDRLVVGHPFNPPYLIPLVEVVGGEQTDPAAVDWAVEFYEIMGKKPLKMTRELPGFLANRIQEATWREALHMVANDMATVEEIDAAMVYGPGLRWAFMGPCLTFHLAGGAGGMAHMLDHFGPALLEPWTWLEAPELTPQLRQRMIDGCEREADGRSVQELIQQRDDFLVDLLTVLRRHRVL